MTSFLNKITPLFIIIVTACSFSSYQVFRKDQGKVGLIATGDRILLSCENVQDPEEPIEKDGRYGFMVLVLDNQNTVTTFVQMSIVTQKDCLARVELFEKMKRTSKRFYIAGYGDIEKAEKKIKYTYQFSNKGTFLENGKNISFAIFKSEDGRCFTKNYGEGKPCPLMEDFPLAIHPF